MTETTKRLYYDSPDLEFTGVVSDIRLNSRDASGQLWQIALDRTAFYPEGGGQPWDVGTLHATSKSGATLQVPVERVEEDEAGEVWHFVRKPLVQGTEVTGLIDAKRRQDHEQQHSGQHLLSAVFLKELGAKTVSFHLGVQSSTIDIALGEEMQSLDETDIRHVEDAANQIVVEGRPLMSHWVEREMAEAMLARGDLRKLPERNGPMRIVQMQGIEFNACGGTHVSNTGEIGAITIRRIEKVRQGWRVEFCCGLRAVRTARADYQLLSAVAGRLSVGPGDVPARVDALLGEAKAAEKERRALLDALAVAQAATLVRNAESGALVTHVFNGRDVEFAKRVASKIAGEGHAAVMGATDGVQGAVAFAKAPGAEMHAGNLLRNVLAKTGARGGGSADLAQGTCAAEAVPQVVESLAAAIRHERS